MVVNPWETFPAGTTSVWKNTTGALFLKLVADAPENTEHRASGIGGRSAFNTAMFCKTVCERSRARPLFPLTKDGNLFAWRQITKKHPVNEASDGSVRLTRG